VFKAKATTISQMLDKVKFVSVETKLVSKPRPREARQGEARTHRLGAR
ncbi:hypothetical protein A2U01_0108005, partial [Trifolium medium]|nr:hypothetical protein [Trifolium medium]